MAHVKKLCNRSRREQRSLFQYGSTIVELGFSLRFAPSFFEPRRLGFLARLHQ